MTIHYRSICCVTLLIVTLVAQAHEFWIHPSAFVGQVGDKIGLELKVGQKFRGASLPYLPADIDVFEIINGDSVEVVKGLLGDSRPAAEFVLKPGLNQIIHLTMPSTIHFADEDERWANYVQEDGLERQLNMYPNQSKDGPISERYIRSVKSLVTTERVLDIQTRRLPFEFVMETPVPFRPGTHRLQLLEGEQPVERVFIKLFRYSDRAISDSGYTDEKGMVELDFPSADRYLISGIIIRPDLDPQYDWISFWSAMTLEVLD